MAKVTIEATAHIKNGIMTNDEVRASALSTLGKNDSLLRDVRDTFNAGLADKLVRVATIDGTKYAVVLNNMVQLGAVSVELLDFTTGERKGSVIYGKTKFFSCLDND